MNQTQKLQQRRYKEEQRIRKRRDKLFTTSYERNCPHNYKQHKKKKQLEQGTFRYEITQEPMEFIFMILAILFVIGVVIFINQQENSEVPILEQDEEDVIDMQNIVDVEDVIDMQNISSWNVSSVTDMSDMFENNGS